MHQILNYSVTLIDKKFQSIYLYVEKTSELAEIFKIAILEMDKFLAKFVIGNIDFFKANKKLNQLTKFIRVKNEYSKSI
jgi:hypothetical protein